MLNILEITHDYYGSKVYSRLFDSLSKTGDIVTVVAVPLIGGNSGKDDSVINIDLPESRRFSAFSFARKALKQLEKQTDLNKIDVVHAHFVRDGIIALMIKKKYGIPYVIAVRESCYRNFVIGVFYHRWLFRMIVSEADEIVFISHSLKEKVISALNGRLKEYVETNSTVIPNGIDEYWFENIWNRKRTMHNPVRILSAGEISQRKNQLKVLEAVNSLNDSGKEYVFYIAGKISDKEIYDKLTVQPSVVCFGEKNKEELKDIYREADIFIVPSLHETFGLVYAEALSQGLPVIFTKGEGFDGWFADENIGIAVDCSNAKDIEKAIMRCSMDSSEEIVSLRNKTAEQFRIAEITERYVELYRKVKKHAV